jgi:hypothetical protein
LKSIYKFINSRSLSRLDVALSAEMERSPILQLDVHAVIVPLLNGMKKGGCMGSTRIHLPPLKQANIME